MLTSLARAVSILGHPLLVLPLATLAGVAAAGDGADLPMMLAGFGLLALAVVGWSAAQVRRGRWAHVDASAPAERKRLNRLLLLTIASACLASLAWGRQPALSLALALSACVVAAAMASTRYCKLSLHLAFAVFAGLLLWPLSPWASACAAGFCAVLAWSRLYLSRHVPRDLGAGAVAGLGAGLAFLLLNPHLSA